mmetsp:Transcript_27252/g.63666  ORF Transcript_27252/g.63666 Transcript_27252/m.63666 type:complete len:267 (-) Transcript_27252:646-1446(-)
MGGGRCASLRRVRGGLFQRVSPCDSVWHLRHWKMEDEAFVGRSLRKSALVLRERFSEQPPLLEHGLEAVARVEVLLSQHKAWENRPLHHKLLRLGDERSERRRLERHRRKERRPSVDAVGDELRRREEEHAAQLVVRVDDAHHARLEQRLLLVHTSRRLVEHGICTDVRFHNRVIMKVRCLCNLESKKELAAHAADHCLVREDDLRRTRLSAADTCEDEAEESGVEHKKDQRLRVNGQWERPAAVEESFGVVWDTIADRSHRFERE